MPFSLSRQNRLPSQLIRYVLDEGYFISGKYLNLKVSKGIGEKESRLAVIVSKKYGNAVRRNRFKRLVKEVFRLHKNLFREAMDIVVLARYRRKRQEITYYDIKDDFFLALRKLEIL